MNNEEQKLIEIINQLIKNSQIEQKFIYEFSEFIDIIFEQIIENESLLEEFKSTCEELELNSKLKAKDIIKQIFSEFKDRTFERLLIQPKTRDIVISLVKAGANFYDEVFKDYHHDLGLIIIAYKHILLNKESKQQHIELLRNSIPNEIKNTKIFQKTMDAVFFSIYFPTIEKNVIQSIDIVNNLSKEELSDKKIVLSVIRNYPHIFLECSDELKNNREFILKAMKINDNIFQYLPKTYKQDKEIALMATSTNYFLSHITTKMLHDRDILKQFMKSNPRNIEYLQSSGKLSFDLFDDEELIHPFVEDEIISYSKLSKRLQNKKRFILLAIENEGLEKLFEELPLKFRKYRKIALEAIKQNENNYSYLEDNFKNNERFLLRALKENNDLARVIVKENPQIFFNSKLLALYIVKKYNNAISFLSEDLRNDKEIIINAVIGAQSSNYFNLIPKHFWNDKIVVLKAIENEENYLKFASPQIQALCQGKDPIATLTKAIEVEKLHKEIQDELPPKEQQIEPTKKKLKKI